MYKKSVQGWLKHLDFMILDVVCLWISFTLAFNMRHGSLDVLANSLYRDMMWSLALMDIVVIFFFDSLKNVLKRGFYQEFVMTVKQTCLITLCSVFYLFTFKEAENYSRLVLGYTAALYLLLSYVLRCLWKNCLRKYFGGAEKRSLLIVTVSDIVDTVIDNIKNKNYGDYFVTGVCILDKKAKGRVIDGVTVVADEDDLVEYVCREWVDEVFINIPESEPYPAELLDKFIEMGVVVHMKLAKSQNLLGKKQFVEHLGTYTVLTTSINSVSRRQIILKRIMDIAGGLAGCIITGILCIFVGPAIYIQSPGPIFFKQTRVGKNGKMFQMYKFRSMYMDAEERKLLIVTSEDVAEQVVLSMQENNYARFSLAGVAVIDADWTGREIHGVPVVANEETAAMYVCQEWIDEVLIVVSEVLPYPAELIEQLSETGVTIHLNLAKITSVPGKKQFVEKVGNYTVLTTSINYASTRQLMLKRLMDIAGGLVGCIFTGIICIFVGPAIYIASPGPIFFAQERVGKNGKKFKMYKFRSMYMDAEERKAELMKDNKLGDGKMFKLDFDPRVIGNKILPDGTHKTGIGDFIRRTSLDEFPQFFNVLRGDMSIIGTRPPLISETNLYELHHRARLAIKPGITGMWQVSGRSDITDFEEVVRLDKEYITNWNIGLDIKILFKTVMVVFRKDGSM